MTAVKRVRLANKVIKDTTDKPTGSSGLFQLNVHSFSTAALSMWARLPREGLQITSNCAMKTTYLK